MTPPSSLNQKHHKRLVLVSDVVFWDSCIWKLFKSGLSGEFKIDLITTAPSVIYNVLLTDGTEVNVDNPSNMPDPQKIDKVEEPYVRASIMVPNEYVGAVMELSQAKTWNIY